MVPRPATATLQLPGDERSFSSPGSEWNREWEGNRYGVVQLPAVVVPLALLKLLPLAPTAAGFRLVK